MRSAGARKSFRSDVLPSTPESKTLVSVIRPIERHLRRHLASELSRQRFDRAKRFVYEAKRGGSREIAHQVNARWLKFLCSRTPVQRDIWPESAAFLHHFATVFGLPPAERRRFVALSLMGWLWRDSCLHEFTPELMTRLTRVMGWEHFDQCRRDGAGLILVPVHGQFSRWFRPYLRHRGHDSLTVGVPEDKLEAKGFRTPTAKRFELARQMHAAKHLLARGGIACNLPDARQNLDSSRSVEFFGRPRRIATGFAELALTTGAHVVPIAYRFSPRGFFVLEFGAPFHVLGPQSTHDERVDSLVAQYASFLRDEWRRYPWNVHWNQLRAYCLLPEVDLDAPDEADGAISRRAQALPQ
jgi:lauroyl/myristoyl acyltransferase